MGRPYIKEKLPIIYVKKLFEIWLFKALQTADIKNVKEKNYEI